jgi:hypothetical protein
MLKNYFYFLILAYLIQSNVAYATITVKSINGAKNTAILKLSEQDEITVDSLLEYKESNGKSCILKVKKVVNLAALAESAVCDNIGILEPGKVLEPKVNTDFNPKQGPHSDKVGQSGSRDSRSRRNHFRGGKLSGRVYYSSASEIFYSYKAAGATFNFIDKSTGALGFGVNYSFITDSSFMYGFGGSYEMERKLVSRQSGDGTVTKYTGGQGISLLLLDFNLGYVFKNKGIVFLGLNNPMPSMANMSGVKVSGQLGYQVGLVYLINAYFNIDATLRYLNFSVTASGIKYSLTQFDGVCFGASYIF